MKRLLTLLLTSHFSLLSFSVRADRLSLASSTNYVFSNVAFTNLVCGYGLGTNSPAAWPVRYEDLAFAYEAACEREWTSLRNQSCKLMDSDRQSKFEEVMRSDMSLGMSTNYQGMTSIMPMAIDWVDLYREIRYPISDYSGYVLSDARVSLASSTFAKLEGFDYSIPIASTNCWLGFHPFYEHPTYLTNSNGFRRVMSSSNIQHYVYFNLEAATHMRYKRGGCSQAHSNKYTNADVYGYGYNYSERDGWVRYENTPYTGYGYIQNPFGRLERDTYRYYRTLSKNTSEHWSYTNEQWVYRGSRNGATERIWHCDDISLTVTNYLAMTNEQQAVRVTHAGLVVDYSHTRSITDVDRGNTTKTFSSGYYFYPLDVRQYAARGKILTVHVDLDDIARDICQRIGREAHPSNSSLAMWGEVDYPRPLEEQGAPYVRSNHVSDDLKMTPQYFTGIVKVIWNARILGNND